MENAKKNLVFHFGVGRQASSLKIGYVKSLETLNFTKIPPIFTYICTFGFGIRPKARCFSGFGLKSKTYFRSFTVGDLSPYTFDRYVNLIQSVSPLDLKMLRRARDLVKVKLRH